ncbi:MAG: tetratricopeptide repeat-containing sensor histidine kinase [Bacteroidia bacterium]
MRLNKYIYTYTLAALAACSVAHAQTKQSTTAPTAVSIINQANKEVIKNPTNAYKLASEALELSLSKKDKKSEAQAYNTLGTLYYNAGDYSKAITYFTKAQEIHKVITDPRNEEYTLKYLAESYNKLNKKDIASSYYEKVEKSSNSSSRKTDYRLKNSKIKGEEGKTKEAINDLENELKYNRKLDPKQKIDIYLELGNLYIADNKTQKGVDNINLALKLSNNAPNDSIASTSLSYAWSVYDKNNLTAQNFNTQKLALDTAIITNNLALENTANYNLGRSFMYTDANKAVPYFQRSEALTKNQPKKIDHIKAVESLSEAYERSGEYKKALEKYKEYIGLVDSIKESDIAGKLQNEILTNKYDIQESRIKELLLKQIEKEKAIRSQRNTILGLIFGISAFLILTYFLVKNIRQKQRANTIIQLASLRSQMNPHFIFNSLNSVNGFISNNEERKANRYISDFSKLMRTVLNNSNNPTITLADEIKSLEIYMSLEHSRFEDKFDYEIVIDQDLNSGEIEVPPMLIQPYVENAVWHGLRYRETIGFLLLHIAQKGSKLIATIEDNGIGRTKSQKLKTAHQQDYKSTGIANTKERIRLLNKLHGENFSVVITDLEKDEVAQGTRVEIEMPLNTKVYA